MDYYNSMYTNVILREKKTARGEAIELRRWYLFLSLEERVNNMILSRRNSTLLSSG